MRNLMFGTRLLHHAKGVDAPVGVYELVDSFVDPTRRLDADTAKGFTAIARRAVETNTFDLWIHSCLQVDTQSTCGTVQND